MKKLFRYTSEPVSKTIPNIINKIPEIFSIHNIFDLIFVKNTKNLSIAIAETKNGIVWISQNNIPPKGVSSGDLSIADLQVNQDYEPKGWTSAQIKQKLIEFKYLLSICLV